MSGALFHDDMPIRLRQDLGDFDELKEAARSNVPKPEPEHKAKRSDTIDGCWEAELPLSLPAGWGFASDAGDAVASEHEPQKGTPEVRS